MRLGTFFHRDSEDTLLSSLWNAIIGSKGLPVQRIIKYCLGLDDDGDACVNDLHVKSLCARLQVFRFVRL
ncbi:unnamed protein product [Camellia sinensis]